MTEMPTPTVTAGEQDFRQLKQVTVHADDEITRVNELLVEGWRLLSIGHRQDATIYVLGRADEKQRARTGFLPAG